MQSPLRAGTLVLRGPSRCNWSCTLAQLRGAYCRKSLTFVAPESSLLCSHRLLWHQRAFCRTSQTFLAQEGILQSDVCGGRGHSAVIDPSGRFAVTDFRSTRGHFLQSDFYGTRGYFIVIDTLFAVRTFCSHGPLWHKRAFCSHGLLWHKRAFCSL